jgi:hypothetical protein
MQKTCKGKKLRYCLKSSIVVDENGMGRSNMKWTRNRATAGQKITYRKRRDKVIVNAGLEMEMVFNFPSGHCECIENHDTSP